MCRFPVNNSLISHAGISDTEGSAKEIPLWRPITNHSISGLKDGDKVIIHQTGRDLLCKMNRYFSKVGATDARNGPARQGTSSSHHLLRRQHTSRDVSRLVHMHMHAHTCTHICARTFIHSPRCLNVSFPLSQVHIVLPCFCCSSLLLILEQWLPRDSNSSIPRPRTQFPLLP